MLSACGVDTPVFGDNGTQTGTSSATTTGTSAGTASGTSAGTSAGTTAGTAAGAGSGTAAGTGAGTAAGTGAGTPSGGGDCIRCADILNGIEGTLCGLGPNGCQMGSSCAIFERLLECACNNGPSAGDQGCKNVCPQTCGGDGGMDQQPACGDCLSDGALSPACQQQLNACFADA